jgi:hypothetical protein
MNSSEYCKSFKRGQFARRQLSQVARRDISRRRNNLVAFRAKRTFSELALQNRINDYTAQATFAQGV